MPFIASIDPSPLERRLIFWSHQVAGQVGHYRYRTQQKLSVCCGYSSSVVLPDLVLLSITVVAYPSYHKTICPIHYPRSFHLKA